MSNTEPILTPNDRVSAVPIDPKYNDIWENFNKQMRSFWVPGAIKFTEDVKHFPSCPPKIRKTTLKVYGFFAGSDDTVAKNLSERFIREVQIPEIVTAYAFQNMMELCVHAIVYNNAIVALVPDLEKRRALFNAVKTEPSVALKNEWAQRWIESDSSFAHRCVAFICFEGIHFSSSFAWIDYLKTQKYKLDGTYVSNDEISRDENSHVELATLIYHKLANKLSEAEIKEIIDGALKVEYQFIDDIIDEDGFIGMNRALMKQHVFHCAAIIAADLGYPGIYKNTSCPFSFMVKRSLNSKTNFFEREETQYSLIGGVDGDPTDREFDPNVSWWE